MLRASTYVTIIIALLFPVIVHGQQGSPGTGGAPSQRQLDGRALAEEVVKASGGGVFWSDKSWGIAFDFVVMRDGKEMTRASHDWFRSTDGYTVSGSTKDGKKWRVSFSDIMARHGYAEIDGARAPDTLHTRLLDMGYGRFINDTYWLLMPLKLLDSGVHHRREPDTTIDGMTYNVLNLSFGHVGLTPGDRYWLYIDPATKLVKRWRYLLESAREGNYRWEDYKAFGPITLAQRRISLADSSEIRFENIRVEQSRARP